MQSTLELVSMGSGQSLSEISDECETHRYTDDLPEDISTARNLLEKYSGVEPDQVKPHILKTYNKAIQHQDLYPCISSFRFLQFHITRHPLYRSILNRLSSPTSDQVLLDLGCCFGQDVRHLVFDGARSEHIYGIDLHRDFLDLGFELFNDRDRLNGHFLAGDIFEAGGEVDRFVGKVDMISATAFLHLFSWDDQVKVCRKMVKFLKPVSAAGGSQPLIFGRQSATTKPGLRVRKEVKWGRQELYLHDIESFRRLWDEVGNRTGTEWKVEAELRDIGKEGIKGIEDTATARLLIFSITRIVDDDESLHEFAQTVIGTV